MPVLPVSPVLDTVIYNPCKIGGLRASPNGASYNLNEWYCRGERC